MQTSTITGLDQLRALYRPPGARAASKVVSRIDPASARFIARCPLVLLGTADQEGNCDVSPRGGPPGFVQVLDERHVAVPDLNGNNRLDSSSNLVANGNAGLLFVVPGKEETLRINGPARLTTADEVLNRIHTELRRPKMALVVETRELFVHCAKAFRRSKVWQPDSWSALDDAPDLAEILACQTGKDAGGYRAVLTDSYDASFGCRLTC